MAITDSSILHHLCIVLVLLWLLSFFNCCHPVAYFISLVYIYLVHERYVMRLRRKIRFQERRQSNQRRVLSESETVRWLNLAVEKIWPVCMEQIVSQKILLPIMPWFLQKFKPWTVKEAVVQELYMGRSPPILTEIRVIRDPTGDDHLVLELGMNFLTAEDMNAILAVKLTKRLGFGMWTKLHLLGLHVEGKVKVGVKFLPYWPFLGRLRVCFVEPPYFQMTVKPLFTHGVDVTELPGIAGWLDKLLGVAFEQTLVEPNMLVVDMEKFVSPQQETWFSVDEKKPVGYAVVEVIEGADMKPSDLNGLADPYVKGQLGPYRFRTKIQKKTLAPKWQEEFKVPICTWESPNVLDIAVHDKDIFNDDTLGDCSININNIRGSQRTEMWLPLRNIKMGRLHLAITVVEGNGKDPAPPRDSDTVNDSDEKVPTESETAEQVPLPTSTGKLPKSPTEKDKYEPIKVEGHEQTGMWVHSPGSEISPVWEPRKGRNRLLDEKIEGQSSSRHDSFKSSVSNSNVVASTSSDESVEGSKDKHPNKVMRGMKKFRSIFHKSPKNEDSFRNDEDHPFPSPPPPPLQPNLRDVNAKKAGGVKLIIEDNSGISPPSQMKVSKSEGTESNDGSERDSPRVRDRAKGIIKNAGKSAMKHVLSRKWSKKSREDDTTSVGTERDFTSDDESPPSQDLTSTGISVVSRPLAGGDNGSLKSGEDEVAKSVTELTVDVPGVYNVILEGDEGQRDDVPSGKSQEHDGDDTTSGKSQEHDGDDTTTSQNKLSSDVMVTATKDGN